MIVKKIGAENFGQFIMTHFYQEDAYDRNTGERIYYFEYTCPNKLNLKWWQFADSRHEQYGIKVK